MQYTPEEKEQIKRMIHNFIKMSDECRKIYVAYGEGINIGAERKGE